MGRQEKETNIISNVTCEWWEFWDTCKVLHKVRTCIYSQSRMAWCMRTFRNRLKKKKQTRVSFGFSQVSRVLDRPVRSTGSNQVFILDGFLFYPDQSSHRVDRAPGRPVGLIRVYNYALNTHLQPPSLQSLGGGIKSHIPWLKNKNFIFLNKIIIIIKSLKIIFNLIN